MKVKHLLAIATTIVSTSAMASLSPDAAIAQTPRPAPAPAATAPAPAGERHSIDGEVTKVDAKKGWVDVKTADGRMKLHFPPSALQNVKAGDRVTVEVGLRRMAAAAK